MNVAVLRKAINLSQATGDAHAELDALVDRLDHVEAELRALHNEVDCRIDHGADSNGHLEYVRTRLAALLAECEERVAELEKEANHG